MDFAKTQSLLKFKMFRIQSKMTQPMEMRGEMNSKEQR